MSAAEGADLVRLERVTRRFGPTVAVDALELAIGRGEFVTLLGPSGCGKSTTLRMVGGFESPDEGRVLIDGRDVTRVPPNRRDVNMVFQDYALFPHLSVRRNVAFGLELMGANRADIDARTRELLELLELGALGERRPDELSGGQRQRVALARALARDPSLLLLDEPLGALDARLRTQLQVELKALQRRTGKTFLFVTHDQEEALTMSDRIVVMNAGRIEQDGAPETLYSVPRTRFVAGFIGESSFVEGRVASVDGDRVTIDWYGRAVTGSVGARDGGDALPVAGRPVTAVIRPENVRVEVASAASDRPDPPGALRARVRERLYKGNRTLLTLALGESDDAPTLLAQSDAGFASDAREVRVSWAPDALVALRDEPVTPPRSSSS